MPVEVSASANQKQSTTNTTEVILTKITKDEIIKVLAEHKKWLDSNEKEGRQANLKKLDMSGLDLQGLNFTKADCSEANMAHTNLTGAIFDGADMYYTNLSYANIENTSFEKTIMQGTDISNVENKDITNMQNILLDHGDIRDITATQIDKEAHMPIDESASANQKQSTTRGTEVTLTGELIKAPYRTDYEDRSRYNMVLQHGKGTCPIVLWTDRNKPFEQQKGNTIKVDGYLKTDIWKDARTGETKSRTYIAAHNGEAYDARAKPINTINGVGIVTQAAITFAVKENTIALASINTSPTSKNHLQLENTKAKPEIKKQVGQLKPGDKVEFSGKLAMSAWKDKYGNWKTRVGITPDKMQVEQQREQTKTQQKTTKREKGIER